MLRIRDLQQRFGLSDQAREDALNDVPLYRELARLDCFAARRPDEARILRFGHLLTMHALSGDLLRVVNDPLQHRGPTLRSGKAVDIKLIGPTWAADCVLQASPRRPALT